MEWQYPRQRRTYHFYNLKVFHILHPVDGSKQASWTCLPTFSKNNCMMWLEAIKETAYGPGTDVAMGPFEESILWSLASASTCLLPLQTALSLWPSLVVDASLWSYDSGAPSACLLKQLLFIFLVVDSFTVNVVLLIAATGVFPQPRCDWYQHDRYAGDRQILKDNELLSGHTVWGWH